MNIFRGTQEYLEIYLELLKNIQEYIEMYSIISWNIVRRTQ